MTSSSSSNREVTRVDARAKTITFEGGETMDYDALLVATGGAPVRLNIPGSDLKNVCVLRSFADADSIIETAKRSRRAVVVGASFIGMEAAYSLRERGLEVTVVAPSQEPFETTLGAEVGALFRRLHESHGVRFKLGSIVYRFEGSHNVEAVTLDNGERIETDMVVVGAGVRPVTHFSKVSSWTRRGPSSLIRGCAPLTDSMPRATSSAFPIRALASACASSTGARRSSKGVRRRATCWGATSRSMGFRSSGRDSLTLGCFTSATRTSWDEIIYRGDVSSHDFLAFYVKGDRVLAVAGMNRDREMAAAEELMRLDRMPAREQLKWDDTSLVEMLHAPEAINA